MTIDPKSITVKNLPLVWKDELISFAKEAGIELERLQYRLVNIAKAEFGKLDWQEGKTGVVKVGKGAKSARVNQGKSVEITNPHASIVMFREVELVNSLTAEFPDIVVPLSIGTREFITEVCEKLGLEHRNKEALAKNPNDPKALEVQSVLNALQA